MTEVVVWLNLPRTDFQPSQHDSDKNSCTGNRKYSEDRHAKAFEGGVSEGS